MEVFCQKIPPIDGLFGKKTQRAVIAFQQSKNLSADGIVDNQTWNYLEIYGNLDFSPIKTDFAVEINKVVSSSNSNQDFTKDNASNHSTLKLGDGINTPELQDEVKYLQTLLKEKNFLDHDSLTDGLFWQKTDLGVKEFQKSRSLSVNGIVDDETWRHLESQVIYATLEENELLITGISSEENNLSNINTDIQIQI
jgi:peptidoglycan hydrolase-like protein with peptidoglycan-binding domain